MSDSHDLEMQAWAKTAQDENDRAQELEVRLEAAEQILRDLLEGPLAGVGPTENIYVDAAHSYLAVPARGEGRAPEGGSTPPAAIELIKAGRDPLQHLGSTDLNSAKQGGE